MIKVFIAMPYGDHNLNETRPADSSYYLRPYTANVTAPAV